MISNKKTLTVSVIIPVYNEEDYLEGCLDSIAAQSVKPKEVIVVDNNSTDRSVQIAKNYDFVKVIHESRQHQAFAQHTGFSVAKGDIFARIDADTILPSDWVNNISGNFENSPQYIAVTGSGSAYDLVLTRLGKFVLDKYYIIAYHLAGQTMMWGSNCAFRAITWPKISDKLTLRNNIWEDYDLAFCLGKQGKIKLVDNIDVKTSFRAIHKPLLYQIKYQFRSARTFRLHKSIFRSSIFFMAWSTMIIFMPLVLLDRYVLMPIKQAKTLKFFGLGRIPKTDTTGSSK